MRLIKRKFPDSNAFSLPARLRVRAFFLHGVSGPALRFLAIHFLCQRARRPSELVNMLAATRAFAHRVLRRRCSGYVV